MSSKLYTILRVYVHKKRHYMSKKQDKEEQEDKSIYTWLSAIVCDAANGELAQEYDLYGVNTISSALRCLFRKAILKLVGYGEQLSTM